MSRILFRDIAVVDEGYAVRDHADILVEGEKIIAICDTIPETPGATACDRVIDGRGKAALPGFFNVHCHVPMTLLRGYGEGLPLHEWLFGRMIPFENLLTDDDCRWGALLGIAEMLASGAVSFTDMYMHMPGIIGAVQQSGIKANLSHGYSTRKPEERYADSGAHAGWRATRDAADASGGRIIADMSIHAEYTMGGERIAREIADLCRETGSRMHLHLSETRGEHEECKVRRGMTPAAFFDSCGVFDVPATAAHCVWLEDGDLDILARRGVTVAHCPSSNLKLGSGIAPVRKMMDAGVRVGIGTDGAASNNNLDMLEEANLAAMVQKGTTGDPLFLGPAALLELACRNGAMSQGRTDCGSITVGNRADIVLYDLEAPHLQPVHDVLSSVLFAGRASDICLTMVDGRILYENGEFATIDIDRVIREANRIKDEKLALLAAR